MIDELSEEDGGLIMGSSKLPSLNWMVLFSLCTIEFCSAIFRAFFEMSVAINCMFCEYRIFTKVIIMQPDPVPMSIIVLGLCGFNSLISSMMSSVSGRGIRVCLLTIK